MNAKERDKILEELNEGSLNCEYSGNVEFWQKIFDVAYNLGADHKTEELQKEVEIYRNGYHDMRERYQQLKQENKELVEGLRESIREEEKLNFYSVPSDKIKQLLTKTNKRRSTKRSI